MDLSARVLHIVDGDTVAYGDLPIRHRGREQSLDAWIAEEERNVRMMHSASDRIVPLIREAHAIIDRFGPQLQTDGDEAFFDHCMGGKFGYDDILDKLSGELLRQARVRHSSQAQGLIKLGINYLLRSHRRFSRKNGSPYAIHPFMAASIAAQEGADFPTIIATMLHDRVEESIDSFMARQRSVGREPKKRDITDRASGILYSTGLYFFEQARRFSFPHRYFEDINSLVDIIDKLSRTDGQTYYEYLQKIFYQRDSSRQRMGRDVLFRNLDLKMQEVIDVFNKVAFGSGDRLIAAYLTDIDEYYLTHLGREDNRPSDEEHKRDTYRSMTVKLADRLHNTRDMGPSEFSIPKRLYGIGYKNAYFVQHLEKKLCLQKHRSPDMAICLDLIMDLRLATLWQLLLDEERLRREVGEDAAKGIEHVVDEYKRSPAFRQVTPASRGNPLDGLLEQYNAKAHGDPGIFSALDGKQDLQYLHVLTFRSLFENYLAYAAGHGPENRFYVSNFDLGFAHRGRRPKNGDDKTTLRRIIV